MSPRLEIWGGIECSIVSIENTVRNQLQDTGHAWRREDIALLARLGLKTVRYPVLWEMVEAQHGRFDWQWTDERLGDLRDLGISPIAGLVHHGSGPEWTGLADPDFAEKLAHYAGNVARRYPWIDKFTPVNEPFATARISGLYGVWEPHKRDEKACFRITVAECRAIAKAMEAIRRVTPHAKLVQTEDFGRIYSTPELRAQANYENERRWLSLDLLTGRVVPSHPLYGRLLAAGIDPRHLAELAEAACAPDIVGMDYYLTSDRMLDDRLDLHPEELVGGNGRQAYVDIAAVRSDQAQEQAGLTGRIREVWERYHLPLAITELHNGCSRDEHLRWLMEGWEAGLAVREEGIDLRAITSWSLFGARDWNSMMTRNEGHYECGAFDARYTPPRPTIVAKAISGLAKRGYFDHPVLDTAGWWRQEDASPAWARPLVLIGNNRIHDAIAAACGRRRLVTTVVVKPAQPAELLASHNGWGAIWVEHRNATKRTYSGEGSLRLHCAFAQGEPLVLDLPLEWQGMIDTFLDLIIDHHTGHLRCLTQAHSIATNAVVEPVSGAGINAELEFERVA